MIFNNPVFIFARGGSKGIKNKNIKNKWKTSNQLYNRICNKIQNL